MENEPKKPEKESIRRAIALRYREGENQAPVVTASGQGWIAERIIDIAKNSGIHVHQDETVVDALKALEIGEEIPEELYQTVAAILAFVFRADQNQNQNTNYYEEK